MATDEPYWRTNTSFSPPVSRRWNHSFHAEVQPTGSHNVTQFYGSSTSSIDKESRLLMRGEHFANHSASDGAGSYFSSPSDSSQTQQWTPIPMKGFNIDDSECRAMREPPGALPFTLSMEGTSTLQYSAGSTSSRSDGSDYEAVAKYISSSRNLSSRCSFMSKPIHPISFTNQAPERETLMTYARGSSFNVPIPNNNRTSQLLSTRSVQSVAELQSTEFPDAGSITSQRELLRPSSASSSMDFTDVSEQLDSESIGPSYNLAEGFRCGLCERFLSQRSPWSSRSIVRSVDMPVTGVLPCCHVFHSDCLEQTTPKMLKQDPPCPVCSRSGDNIVEQPVVSRLKNGLPLVRPFAEDGPSRPWRCGQMGDCVEGALHGSPRNNMLLLNRSRIKKHLSLKGNSSKDMQGKLKKSGTSSLQLLHGRSVEAVGCSRAKPGLVLRK